MLRLNKRLAIALLWTISLLLVALVARAQDFLVTPKTPAVVAGENFGFRVTGTRNGRAVGTLVVKENGEWIDAEIGASPKPLTLR